MFFTHFASKNQLPGFSVIGTLAGNGLMFPYKSFTTVSDFLLCVYFVLSRNVQMHERKKRLLIIVTSNEIRIVLN